MDLLITTLADRPDLAALLDTVDPWPEFMKHDPIGSVYYADAETAYPGYVLVAQDPAEPDRLVAKGYSVPFGSELGDDVMASLPGNGWDGVILAAARDRFAGRTGGMVSALEISIRPDRQGRHLAGVMLAAMRDNTAARGHTDLVAPVRPNGKHRQPDLSIDTYAAQVRDDGLPVDPWLRVHVRAGGVIVGTAARAMAIAGTTADWREWTGLPFDTSGPVMVPEALVPVHCDVERDHAVYCEPCVWVRHRLR